MPATTPVQSFPPAARADAQVLILGSMPGTASLAAVRYYAHPRNQFWPIMGALVGADAALPYPERLLALQGARIALWDVMASCVRPGSLDARIDSSSVVANDIAGFLEAHPAIHSVFFNGAAAEAAFRRHVLPTLTALPRVPALHRLPSTSPAHAARGFEDKLEAWRAVTAALQNRDASSLR